MTRIYPEHLLDMDEESKATLEKFNAEQADWFAWCPKCGARREGRLEELRKEHLCSS